MLEALERKRGESDARAGHPPAAFAGPYLEGYNSVPWSERSRGRVEPTYGGCYQGGNVPRYA